MVRALILNLVVTELQLLMDQLPLLLHPMVEAHILLRQADSDLLLVQTHSTHTPTFLQHELADCPLDFGNGSHLLTRIGQVPSRHKSCNDASSTEIGLVRHPSLFLIRSNIEYHLAFDLDTVKLLMSIFVR